MFSTPELQRLADGYAMQYGVPSDLFRSVIGAESSWNPYAYNLASGAAGLAQVLPSTAADPGYGVAPVTNPYDPRQALRFAASYLAALRQRFGSWTAALQRYSGSSGTPYPRSGAVQTALGGLEGFGAIPVVAGAEWGTLPEGLPDRTDTPGQGGGGITVAYPSNPTWLERLQSAGINAAAVLVGVLLLALGAYFLAR